jgi:hypothetical protein
VAKNFFRPKGEFKRMQMCVEKPPEENSEFKAQIPQFPLPIKIQNSKFHLPHSRFPVPNQNSKIKNQNCF